MFTQGGSHQLFNWWLEADSHVSVKSNRVYQWRSKTGAAIATQANPRKQPLLKAIGLNYNPVIVFDGKNQMQIEGFTETKGTHTFVTVTRPKSGAVLLADVQALIDRHHLQNGWAINFIEYSDVTVTGPLSIGASTQALKAEVALLAYKNGALTQGQKETLINQLERKYKIQENQCPFWCCKLFRR
jgi:hypothetical protein